MDVRGVFSTYELSSTEKDVFAEYLQNSLNTPIIPFIRYMLGDNEFLKFLDILSGTNFKVPSSKTLERDLNDVRIFIYVKSYDFSEAGLSAASKAFGKTVLNIRRSVYKVSKVLGIEDSLEGDLFNNYLMYIKNVEEGIKKDSEVEKDVNGQD